MTAMALSDRDLLLRSYLYTYSNYLYVSQVAAWR